MKIIHLQVRNWKTNEAYCRDKELQIAMFFMSCKLYIEDYLLLRPPSSNPLNCKGLELAREWGLSPITSSYSWEQQIKLQSIPSQPIIQSFGLVSCLTSDLLLKISITQPILPFWLSEIWGKNSVICEELNQTFWRIYTSVGNGARKSSCNFGFIIFICSFRFSR